MWAVVFLDRQVRRSVPDTSPGRRRVVPVLLPLPHNATIRSGNVAVQEAGGAGYSAFAAQCDNPFGKRRRAGAEWSRVC